MSDQMQLVDALAMEYFEGLERGAPPDLEKLTSRLPDESSREELRQLIDTARWARKSFPETLRADAVLADRYVLLEELGSGGYGKVWKARDRKLDRLLAIKVLHPLQDLDKGKSILRRERLALARVNHPAIVRFLDSGEDGDHHFLTMEYVEGIPLDQLIQRLAKAAASGSPDRQMVESIVGLPRTPGEGSRIEADWYRTAASIMVEILGALALAHGEKVFHRDLKPQNVILRPGARPVLLDFGLAGLGELESGSVTQRLFGTLEYIAPEQFRNERTGKDSLTDVYQCGLILYELLAFQRAFPGKNRTQLVAQLSRGLQRWPGTVRKGVPPMLEDICMKALEANPDRRYASAGAFLADLERFLDGGIPEASRLGTAGRAMMKVRHQVRQHRAVVLSGGLVLLAVAVTAMLQPDAPDLVARQLDPVRYELKAARPLGVYALHVGKDAAGSVKQIEPVQIQLGADGRAAETLKLAVGPNDVQVHDPTKVSNPTGLEWHQFEPHGEEVMRMVLAELRLRRQETGKAVDIADALSVARNHSVVTRGAGGFDAEQALRQALGL